MDNRKEVTGFKTLADWQAAAKKAGARCMHNTKARAAVQPMWCARKGEDLIGTFSGKYPKDSFLLV